MIEHAVWGVHCLHTCRHYLIQSRTWLTACYVCSLSMGGLSCWRFKRTPKHKAQLRLQGLQGRSELRSRSALRQVLPVLSMSCN